MCYWPNLFLLTCLLPQPDIMAEQEQKSQPPYASLGYKPGETTPQNNSPNNDMPNNNAMILSEIRGLLSQVTERLGKFRLKTDKQQACRRMAIDEIDLLEKTTLYEFQCALEV